MPAGAVRPTIRSISWSATCQLVYRLTAAAAVSARHRQLPMKYCTVSHRTGHSINLLVLRNLSLCKTLWRNEATAWQIQYNNAVPTTRHHCQPYCYWNTNNQPISVFLSIWLCLPYVTALTRLNRSVDFIRIPPPTPPPTTRFKREQTERYFIWNEMRGNIATICILHCGCIKGQIWLTDWLRNLTDHWTQLPRRDVQRKTFTEKWWAI